jgi:hypothetical protein
VKGFDLSTVHAHGGSNSMHAYVDGSSSSAQFNLVYSTPQDFTGYSLVAWAWVDASLSGCQIQGFILNPGWNAGGWTTFNSGNVGQWVKVTYSLSGTMTGTTQIGFQFYSLPSGVTGNVYLDDIHLAGPPPTSCQVLIDSFESPSFNAGGDSVTTSNGTVALNVGQATAALSTSHATLGSDSLDINVTSNSGWLDGFFKYFFNIPVAMGTTDKYIMVDAYVDSSMISDSYNQLQVYADSNDNGLYFQKLASADANVVAGQQTLYWALDYPGTITSSMTLNDISFVLNNGNTHGTGHIYLDNLRFATCP